MDGPGPADRPGTQGTDPVDRPGTQGTDPAVPCPGLIAAWQFHPGAAPRRLDAAAAAAALAEGRHGLWLHFDLLDQRARSLIATLPLPPAALVVLTEADDSAHLELADGVLSGALPDFVYETATGDYEAEMGLLHLALTPRLLVTARRHPLRAIHAVAQGPAGAHPGEALAAMLLRVAEEGMRALQAAAGDLARVEEALLRDATSGRRPELAGLRRAMLQLERRFGPAVEALDLLAESVEEAEEDGAELDMLRPVLRAARRQAALLQAIAATKERARIAQDEMASIVAEQTNRRLFVLSVISAAMLPASLVAGIFGMNVGSVPGVDQDWGFAMAMTLIAGSIIGILGALRAWRLL